MQNYVETFLEKKFMTSDNPTSYTLSRIVAMLSFAMAASAASAEGVDAAKLQSFIATNKSNLTQVNGGDFQMGDFGVIFSDEKLPYESAQDSKPLHKVTLSNFAILKYKVTYGDYDIYAKVNNLPKASSNPNTDSLNKKYNKLPNRDVFPAPVTWYEAHAYCQWLGGQLGQSMDLPTEAQWEYAARARGKFLVFATDNGKYDKSRNAPTDHDAEKMSGDIYAPIAVGLYPPNPLGMYDMSKNGREWVKDWYSEDYYSHSPVQDPQGPETGTRKVLRNELNSKPYPAFTFTRIAKKPDGSNEDDVEKSRKLLNLPPDIVGQGFRCVANTSVAPK